MTVNKDEVAGSELLVAKICAVRRLDPLAGQLCAASESALYKDIPEISSNERQVGHETTRTVLHVYSLSHD